MLDELCLEQPYIWLNSSILENCDPQLLEQFVWFWREMHFTTALSPIAWNCTCFFGQVIRLSSTIHLVVGRSEPFGISHLTEFPTHEICSKSKSGKASSHPLNFHEQCSKRILLNFIAFNIRSLLNWDAHMALKAPSWAMYWIINCKNSPWWCSAWLLQHNHIINSFCSETFHSIGH